MTKEKSSHTFGILWIALALLLTWSALALAGGDDTDIGPGGKNLSASVPQMKAGPVKPPILGPNGPDEFGPPNEMQKQQRKLLQLNGLPVPGGSDDRQ